jgi:hypothetical protein
MTTTFLAALRSDGLTAPLVVDGPIDGATFLTWVRLELAPTLRPGDIVDLNGNPQRPLARMDASWNINFISPPRWS